MAHASHLKWLKEGAEEWNERRKNRHFVPNLRNARLDGANLSGFNLRGALLSGAHLRGAILDRANLRAADLTAADLTGASLAGVRAEAAAFSKAKLVQADISNAFMTNVIFTNADLSKAVLAHSLIYSADFTGAITHETIVRSAGDGYPPSIDLSGCVGLSQRQVMQMLGDTGVDLPPGITHPESWPTWAESEKPDTEDELVTPAPEHFVFLSYATKDRDVVSRLRLALTDANIPLWWDQNLSAGDGWRSAIQSKLDTAAAVLTVWSANSTSSKAVREEASRAQADGKLVHIRIDDAALAYGFSETQYLNFQKWDGSPEFPEFRRLVQSLEDKLRPPTREEIENRLTSFAPMEAVLEDGLITAKDSPATSKPPIENARDLNERLQAQEVLATKALDALEELDNNLGEAIKFDLRHFAREVKSRPASWYILTDSIADIRVHLENEDIPWPGSTRNTIERLCKNHEALRPLLEPVQPKPSSPDARAVPPEISPLNLSDEAISDLSQQAASVFSSPDAESVFAEPAARAAEYLTDAVNDARASNGYGEEGASRRLSKIRHAIKVLAGFVGTAIAQISFGLSGSLIASPDAAQTFVENLKRLFEHILSLF